MSLPGVVGIGEGERGGAPCILVLVTDEGPDIRNGVPRQLEGHSVEIVVTGEVSKT